MNSMCTALLFWPMNLVRPKCRTRLSAEDFAFIQSVLLETVQDEIALKSLLLDPEMLDAILDQKELYEAIQDCALTVNISAQLYFYVLVRQTLLNADIDDREMADYIASLLISFSREDHQKKLFPELKEPMHYLIDIVTQIEKSDYYHRFFLYAHLGNQTHFFSPASSQITSVTGNNAELLQDCATMNPWEGAISRQPEITR